MANGPDLVEMACNITGITIGNIHGWCYRPITYSCLWPSAIIMGETLGKNKATTVKWYSGDKPTVDIIGFEFLNFQIS